MESNYHETDNYKENPRQRAWIYTLGFIWTIPLFIKGLRTDLNEDILCKPLKEHTSSLLGDRLEKEWNKEIATESPELWKALWRLFGGRFILYGIGQLLVECLKISQPISLAKLLEFFRPGQTTMGKDEAFLYASLIYGASFINLSCGHLILFGLSHIGMKIRVACCSLIYRKALRLSSKAMSETTIGQMVNLLSNDVNRFDHAVMRVHILWIAPIEALTISYLLYAYVGPTSFVGVGLLCLYVPLQICLSRKYAVIRRKTAASTDKRIRLMNEIITGIQVIKMYAWEIPFAKLVEGARRFEIQYVRQRSFIQGIINSLSIFSTRLAVYLTILTYVLLGNSLTPVYVYILFSFSNILREAMTTYLPSGLLMYAEGRISILRIQTFLLQAEVPKDITPPTVTEYKHQENRIKIKEGTTRWTLDAPENTLSKINLSVKDGELVTIIGTVGSGKSTLLQVMLKELPLEEGDLCVNGSISYASQESWLFGASVKQNILFGQPYVHNKYKDVIKVCALEQDFKLFPHGDHTLVGERGIMVSGGQKARINLARAVYKDADIYLLDDPLSAVDSHVGQQLFEDCIRTYLRDKCVILVTHQLQYLKSVKHIVFMDKGEISGEGTYKNIQEINKAFTSSVASEEEEAEKVALQRATSLRSIRDKSEIQQKPQETRSTGTIKGCIYINYIRSFGSILITFYILSTFVLTQFAVSGGDYFLTYWLNVEQSQYKKNTTADSEVNYITFITRNMCITIYSIIIFTTMVFSLVRSIGYFLVCMRASINLHDKMFSSMVFAPMRFFSKNTSGQIINRFSKDMGTVDDTLPAVLMDTLQISICTLGISTIIAIINPIFYLITLTLLVILYAMRTAYLRTSRDVKRLEATTRSPVFTHVTATLQGLSTIRAFKAEKVLIKEFDHFQDIHSSAWYMFMSTSRAFGCWVDFICTSYVGMVIFSFLLRDENNCEGNVGLAISQALCLAGMFQWGMRQWSELENQMTSVERVVEYTTLEKERTTVDKPNTKKWPDGGCLKFEKVSLRYSETEPYVLNDISFVIHPNEKVGIVGRTGAGKSSLIVALFQLTETEGDIIIDDVNVNTITLQELRSNISIIPQEPVLFSGTMRKNLDPFDEYSDVELWSALEEVELKKVLSELPTGLNTNILEGGTNFSVGQRQLICLARAIVRKNKILVLDEATANVDPQTDSLIQQTIRRKFSDCTVLTIAHRLNTIMDSDRVLVMDSGSVREFDHPYVLLQNKDGFFTKMLERTGKNMAESLKDIAKKVYENREK